MDNAVALQMGRSEAQMYRYMHLSCHVKVNAGDRGQREPEKRLD
jgi:hypothetical protein